MTHPEPTRKGTPTPEDAARCMEIRKCSKKGGRVSPAEMKFCNRMFKKYPDWYASGESAVFNATVPFGSNVRA